MQLAQLCNQQEKSPLENIAAETLVGIMIRNKHHI